MIRKQLLSFVLAAGFLLGVHNGYIALWRDGTKDPMVFPCRAMLLPRADRLKLERESALKTKMSCFSFWKTFCHDCLPYCLVQYSLLILRRKMDRMWL